MRGNWKTAEALVLGPSQQQLQQQQQSILEEQPLPLHSPTTPAWVAITERIVKEESVEDKNDDSGMSQGHCTSNSVSPRSRRSSTTVNCSLSPGSATSQESNAMQCDNFEYSPQSLYKNCDSPLLYQGLNGIDELAQSRNTEHQNIEDVSNEIKETTGNETEVPQETLQCPLCSFTTLNRAQFNEHLGEHYAVSCETLDYRKCTMNGEEEENPQAQSQAENFDEEMNEENRASPLQDERSKNELEETEEPGLRTPRLNSQGKVKTFRCKQCSFVAITKLEFWEHSRSHIKAEKLLTCPKCAFVTEYKHHLEYHLRNHFGSKPFKCNKCSYSCVNKSMLNSHLKSHSNVYQYRCANCSYATKYCHSLKLHLRKYIHRPAMVLNADGSPNPLPIIDVYGTRRGPKQKSNPTNYDEDATTAEVSPITRNCLLSPLEAIQTLSTGVAQGVINFPYNHQVFSGFPIANNYQLADDASEKLECLKSNLMAEYAKIMAMEHPPVALNMIEDGNKRSDTESENERSSPTFHLRPANPESTKFAPLDLSKPDACESTQSPEPAASDASNNNHPSASNNMASEIAPSSPKLSGTSRRKGRAVKIEKRVVKEEIEEDGLAERTNRNSPGIMNLTSNRASPTISKETSPERNLGTVGLNNEYTCQYCEIAFGNVVMYTVHMGYHGYKDPYTCNMCGHECDDKLSFFLHIARSKHS